LTGVQLFPLAEENLHFAPLHISNIYYNPSIRWTVEYFEQIDTTQPAEVFEDALEEMYPKLAGKLFRIAGKLQYTGHQLGGGYIEKCHNYQGIWEIRTIYAGMLAREFFAFDGERIVLLHGYVKRTGQPASDRDMKKAFEYWVEYTRTHHISPVEEEDDEQV
jgi:phage-related protein